MKLPRLTPIFHVRLTLKGGAVVEHKFMKFAYKGNAEEITNLKWTCLPGNGPFYIAINTIVAIQVLSYKRQIILRHAMD